MFVIWVMPWWLVLLVLWMEAGSARKMDKERDKWRVQRLREQDEQRERERLAEAERLRLGAQKLLADDDVL